MKTICFYLILLFTSFTYSQNNYGDYNIENRTDIVFEEFSESKLPWNKVNKEWLITKKTDHSIVLNPKNNTALISNNSNEIGNLLVKAEINQSKDFEIEIQFKRKQVFGGRSSGLIWGFDEKNKRKSGIWVFEDDDGNPMFKINQYYFDISGTSIKTLYSKCSNCFKSNQTIKLTARKVSNNLYIFINESFVEKVEFRFFKGNFLGLVYPSSNSVTELKYIRASYINKGQTKIKQERLAIAYNGYFKMDGLPSSCSLSGFKSDDIDVVSYIDNYLKEMGLRRDFVIRECSDVDNIVSFIDDGPLGKAKYLLINPNLTIKIKRKEPSSMVRLIHAIGHNLYGHQLLSQEHRIDDLKIHTFVGIMMYKLGFSDKATENAILAAGNTRNNKSSSVAKYALETGWETEKKNLNKDFHLKKFSFTKNKVLSSNYYARYEKAFASKKYFEAIYSLENGYKYSGNTFYWLALGQTHTSAENWDNSLNYFRMYLTNPPKEHNEGNNDILYQLIEFILRKHKNYSQEQLISLFEVFVDEEPKGLMPTKILLGKYRTERLKNKLKSLLLATQKKKHKDEKLYATMGRYFYELGDYENAIVNFYLASAVNPNNLNHSFSVAILSFNKGLELHKKLDKMEASELNKPSYKELHDKIFKTYESTVLLLEKLLKLKPERKPDFKDELAVMKDFIKKANYKDKD